MPAFVKNPKFIIGTIVVLWVAYIIGANLKLNPVNIGLFPYFLTLQINVSAIIVGSAIFGSAATLLIQFFWRRRRSKNASAPPAASAESNKTVA